MRSFRIVQKMATHAVPDDEHPVNMDVARMLEKAKEASVNRVRRCVRDVNSWALGAMRRGRTEMTLDYESLGETDDERYKIMVELRSKYTVEVTNGLCCDCMRGVIISWPMKKEIANADWRCSIL
jgi:dihydroxyacetone kinase-like predicted kinase